MSKDSREDTQRIEEEQKLAEINKLHCSLSNEDLIKSCKEWISSLAKSGGKSWLLHIPVDFNRDPDMLFSELGARFNNGLVKEGMLHEQLKQKEEQNAKLKEALSQLIKILEDVKYVGFNNLPARLHNEYKALTDSAKKLLTEEPLT